MNIKIKTPFLKLTMVIEIYVVAGVVPALAPTAQNFNRPDG